MDKNDTKMTEITSKQLLTIPIHGFELNEDVKLKNNEILPAGTILDIQIVPSKYNVADSWEEVLNLKTYSIDDPFTLDFQRMPKS